MLYFRSPAKINLFLKILGCRNDGFHELASLFQAVSLYDELSFSCSSKDTFSCNESTIPTDSRNLVIKARNLFRDKTGLSKPVAITLAKNIPHEAGLGGGSSNAATTLWAMNELEGNPVSTQELILWASEIGSDVPFFLSSGIAYCTGRGEKLLDVDPLKNFPMITLLKPNISLSTQSVYQNLNLKSLNTRDPSDDLLRYSKGEFVCYNDLQDAAFSQAPELQLTYDRISKMNFDTVVLSGSGSSFFALGEGSSQPEDIWCKSVRPVSRDHGYWY
ncbi:MAG: 4-(cytidine 5'-diphospho)-2-C-methyl-D-erythritol kinase [Chlamydiota bacterium]|nr:4-(cytidine 5'-diphospho)-2-C-methyl-D-erythritol kinase [Chlamydiota bacterium]